MADVLIRRLSTTQPDFDAELIRLTTINVEQDHAIEATVAGIVDDVRKRGDQAVLEYSRRFDRFTVASVQELEVHESEWKCALVGLAPEMREALEHAASRIRSYHEHQKLQSWQYTDADGMVLGQRITALERVGIYVPGGRAAYPTSVLMNAIPAKVAGVSQVIMVVPTPNGERNPLVLAAAALAGVDRIFAIGGAQAVAALAYGTATIPPVDKIVGPGNAYVAAAKRRVFGKVGIDMIAGPSEILVICDGSTDPEWIAMDLFSQAEHDELAQSILLSPDSAFLDRVTASISRLLSDMPRAEIIRTSLSRRGALIEVRNLEEACAISNRIAPEHLELSVADPGKWLELIKNAGAIFLGAYSSESLGDYCAGPNHVLPTSGTARFSSPLGVYDFQKRSSLIGASASSARKLGLIAGRLADGEGLTAHARSARYRISGEE